MMTTIKGCSPSGYVFNGSRTIFTERRCDHRLGNPTLKYRKDHVWIPAGALYELKLKAGRRAKPPKYWGKILWAPRMYLYDIRVLARIREVIVVERDNQIYGNFAYPKEPR